MPQVATFPELSQYIAKGGQALGVVPSWLVHALAEIGQSEVRGPVDNQRIEAYWKGADIPDQVTDDETPWCAAFVGAMLSSGMIFGTKKANAKSYLQWGDSLPLTAPPTGAIVVLNWPPSDWMGHVGFCAGVEGTRIHILGGNQGDRVSIASFDRARIAGVRWPKEVPLIGTQIVFPVTASNPTTA